MRSLAPTCTSQSAGVLGRMSLGRLPATPSFPTASAKANQDCGDDHGVIKLTKRHSALTPGRARLRYFVTNIALNIFTNYFNSVARTEIDFPALKPVADTPARP